MTVVAFNEMSIDEDDAGCAMNFAADVLTVLDECRFGFAVCVCICVCAVNNVGSCFCDFEIGIFTFALSLTCCSLFVSVK